MVVPDSRAVMTFKTLMLLVANLANTKSCKNLKDDWNPGTWVLSESYIMNTNMTGFRCFQQLLHLCSLDESNLSIGRVNHSIAETTFVRTQKLKNLWKSSKPCHLGIHLKALIEYSQMSTHLPGFQSFSRFFDLFCIGQISHQQHKG